MEEDKKISKMAEVLLAGGKMLATHCPKCGAPLFELGGKPTCPVCDKEIQGPGKEEEKRGALEEISISKMERPLLRKLGQLVAQLEKETSPRAMCEILEPMKLILEILGEIKSG
ncbi:MAG: hypothetical protein J7J17_02495 [Hadesarchaea archaeon]|nr:hypothetical protein [Hadesarchaea archaeon]